jgi:hypothetical protein
MNNAPPSAFFRFKEMPLLLRLVLFPYSLIGSIIFIGGSFIPIVEFEIEGKQVSWSEWWTSGAGPLFTIIGVLLGISAIGFYRKKSLARLTFFSAFAVALLFVGAFEVPTLKGMIVIGVLSLLLGWYFFLKKSVRHYFALDKKGGGSISC